MMKKILMILVAVFLFGAGISRLHAQVMPKSFTDDPVKFMDEMEAFFESYDKKDGKDFIDEFKKTYWETGKVGNDLKQLCYKNANAMLKKKYRPSPEYYSYFNTIKTIVDNAVPQATVNEWQSCFNNLADGKLAKPFSDFIAMSENLFSGNRFFKTASGEWWTEGGSWKFNCDSVSSIVFTGVTLKALAKHDSTKIANTSGVYYPGTGIWKGTGGRVTWERAGLKADDQYADLKTYSITVKSFSYTADSVTFYSKNYFQGKALPGKLTEKLVADAQASTAQFPQFESYSSRYLIKNIYPNVDFEGGYKQVGGKFLGSGTKDSPAYFRFKRNGVDFLTVTSTGFSITADKVTSTNAKIKFAFDKDSITHPSVDFKFFVDSSKVLLYRSEEGSSSAPFYDSFHQVDMYVQQIMWVTTAQTIYINTLPGATIAQATFPSTSYYRQYLYDKLQGMEPIHPLIKLRNFVRDNNAGVKTFTVVDLSHYWKIGPEQLRPLMVNLSNAGFIIYDPNTDMVTYLDKCDTYIAARAGKKDYDNIIFESNVTPGTPNAKINLLNYDMTLLGIKEVALSDSQNVTVFPDSDKVILKKDRNFTFQGSIMAGRFDYYGKLFSFDYKTFTLDLTNVDSVRIWIDTDKRDPQDPKGGFIQMKVKSVIENLNGKLQVDDPANKSGVWSKKYPQYPIFTSAKPSFVYYDKPGIQKGVYNRDKFYFKLDPFTIDSLDNFQNSSLRFAGTFASSGILPDIKDTIRLMPDYSLGFTRIAPSAGYPLYGGKAKFTNEIRLSNQGLRGDGTINYITSTSISNDFIFFPDSMNGVAQSFDMTEQMISGKTEYPQSSAANVYIHWMPKKDFMNATNKDSAFNMMNGNATFDGTLTLGPKKLSGNGETDFRTAQLMSKNMIFKQHTINADTSDFNLKALDQAGLALKTDSVKALIDFNKKEGDFEAIGGGTKLTFPVNQYMCFMKNFKWYMDQGAIEMSGGKQTGGGVNLEGPEFISIHPKQDSLRFRSPKARFDYNNNIIYAKEVPEIDVADAKIVPDSGNVVIRKEANMQTLVNATITANTVTQYHKLFNCVVNISSRHDYQASGDYAYIDELKMTQTIHFAKVQPDTSGQTYAEGVISDTSKFYLSPAFDYRGKVILAANSQFLLFDGTTSLQHDCALGKSRLAFRGEIDPNEIYIPVISEPVDDKGERITSGLVSTTKADSIHIYGTFLSPKLNKADVEVVKAEGYLCFDKATREYRISNKEKLVERSLPGNFVSFSTKTCSVYGEGRMSLGANLGKVCLNVIGNTTHNTTDHSTTFDIVAGVDFFMSDKAMEIFLEDVNASTSLSGTDPSRATFQSGLTEIMGKDKADQLITQLTLYGKYKKFPDELKYTFFFSDIQLVWNSTTHSYISTGKLGLASVGKEQVNKYIPGTFMLERKNSGDVLSMYFELDNNQWYCFQYANGVMTVISSNDKFNSIIKDMKDDDKVAPDDYNKDCVGETKLKYKFTLGSPAIKDLLLKKVKRAGEAEVSDGSGTTGN